MVVRNQDSHAQLLSPASLTPFFEHNTDIGPRTLARKGDDDSRSPAQDQTSSSFRNGESCCGYVERRDDGCFAGERPVKGAGGKHRADSPRIIIAANDPATLVGLRMALEADSLRVCDEVGSVHDLIEAVERHGPDVCLVDVELRGGGIRGAAEVVTRAANVAVVLLADDAGEEQFLDAIRIGAAGYVLKSIAPARLPDVVHAVLRGEPAIPRSLVVALIDRYRQRPYVRHLALPHRRGVDLTSREWEVLDLMREGRSTREIAARLLISEVTVRRHISSVLKKLDVDSRAEALKLLQSA
jgi:DNA-binding NarL/FixJ family response regulator